MGDFKAPMRHSFTSDTDNRCDLIQDASMENHFEDSNKSAVILNTSIDASESSPQAIAIIGMAMRLPGGADSTASFWDLIINKRNGRCRVPGDRYNIDAFYDTNGSPGTVNTEYGHFIDNYDLQHFDSSFFSMSKSEVEAVDPQQRMLLEVVRECLENAGKTSWRGDNIGCYVGTFGEDWLDLGAKDTQSSGIYRITGSGDFLLGNRVSYEFDFKGPSITVKTGCSASMICLHMACQALHNADCSSAIVGGANMIMSPTMSISMAEQGVLSSDGSCKTFDASADGYSRGEAINAIYIKKLSDAIKDGDPIRAIIRSTSTNGDGKTHGISLPSAESHELLIRRAYEATNLDVCETAFIECHGTGTAIGDPLETQAVARVFGDSDVYIGSIKPNVGHSEGASGITSIIKAVLALENKTIPPNINFGTPNPKIPFQSTKMRVPVEAVPWPDKRERVSVNSFGIGGANAHAIIDSASSFGLHAKSRNSSSRLQLLVFSANHERSLEKVIENYQDYIVSNWPSLDDLAYTLGARREHLSYRAFCIADRSSNLNFSLAKKKTLPPSIIFTFTGQGAQWIGMAKQLIEDYPSFRNDIKAMDDSLALLPQKITWKIEGIFLSSRIEAKLNYPDQLLNFHSPELFNEAEFSQPLCTALQIATVNFLRKWGICPAAVVGHSSGEIAAAFTCGALTAAEAIIIAYYRGLVVKENLHSGGMVSVGLGKNDVSPYLRKGVKIACQNSPINVTLSGDLDPLEDIIEQLSKDQPGVFVRRLKVKIAYHSHHMQRYEARYKSMIERYVAARKPLIPFYSSVTGQLLDCDGLGASYWVKNMVSPVQFNSAVQAVLKGHLQDELFLEVGPHSALAAPLRQILKTFESQASYVPTMIKSRDCSESLLKAIGELHVSSVPVDFSVIKNNSVVLTNLPSYPWNHETKYWSESRVSRDWRLRKFPRHEILGSRVMECTDLEPSWRNILSLDNVPWIRDHKIHEEIVFPIAGYIALIGEAIRQITGAKEYLIRDIIVDKAMIFGDSDKIEIVSSFRPVRLTSTLESDWYEFSVSSYQSTEWTKHCTGQARAAPECQPTTQDIEHFSRQVLPSKWYNTMRKVGLNYGKSFQRLRTVSASTNEKMAVASISDSLEAINESYPLHPASIDSCLQLFSVAMTKGVPRLFNQLFVPTSIEEVYLRRANREVVAKATVLSNQNTMVRGDVIALAQGETVMSMTGLRLSLLEDSKIDSNNDQQAVARLTWKPDINFQEPKNLMHTLESEHGDVLLAEKLGLLCVIETSSKFAASETPRSHIRKYLSWLHSQKARAERGEYGLVPGADSYVMLDSASRLSLIETTRHEIATTRLAPLGTSIFQVFQCFEDVYLGNIDPLEVLLQDGVLASLYDLNNVDYSAFLELLSHSKPNLRILEIGAGTGGTTNTALGCLTSPSGERMYSEYYFTDISAGFFVRAKERFEHNKNIKYNVLDISQDPLMQGYEACSFDLIIAANVLHATPFINTTLKNVAKLLRQDGKFFIQEVCPSTRFINYIMGVFPGWWLGEADGRHTEPYISPERWDLELRNAGFAGTDAVIYDNDLPYQINTSMIATLAIPSQQVKSVVLLYNSNIIPLMYEVEDAFVNRGYIVEFCSLSQKPSIGGDIIALMDLEESFFGHIDAVRFNAFKCFLKTLHSAGILWITKNAQRQEPLYALVFGMARTLRRELSIDFGILDVDSTQSGIWDALLGVFEKFQRRRPEMDLDPEYEYTWTNGVVKIGRFHWSPLEQLPMVDPELEYAKRLSIGKCGLLKSLFWEDYQPATLVGSQVEINTVAVGLNFKDVLESLGLINLDLNDEDSGGSGLGKEASGIIRRVGPDVKDLRPGDRVSAIASGAFSSNLIASALLCAKIPDELSFEDAATMPCVYITVMYSLLEIGRLEEDQTVLIHSGCGGVGIAAIQICQMMKAKIFVTVGNQEKKQYLIDTFNIPGERIFNSRNISFAKDVMCATKGMGVDIVLNSLSGELLHASWQCVGCFGKMIELGKRDFRGHAQLRMDPFEDNRAFIGVDLAQLSKERPAICGRILSQCMDFLRLGFIKPVQPSTLFQASQVQDAFRYLQKGQHIGKIVVKMPEHAHDLSSVSKVQQLVLRSDVSYLLIGGLGGFGKSISSWMVQHGAKHLILLSRSAGKSSEDQAFLAELISQDCSVQVFAGSVAKLQDVKEAIKKASRPIAGVLQMSMVLKDSSITQMTYEDWQSVLAPKVQGTWNLHEALKAENLDFFIMFSSVSGIMGQSGQANYAAANTFLDGFVEYRHSLNLPASVLDVGATEDIGYVSQKASILKQFQAMDMQTISEQALLDALQVAIIQGGDAPQSSFTDGATNQNQIVVGLGSRSAVADPHDRCPWKRDIRTSIYWNSKNTASTRNTTAGNESLKDFLSAVPANPSILAAESSLPFLCHEIGASLCGLMQMPVEELSTTRPLVEMGVDSLLAIEVRNWWRQALGLEITTLEIVTSENVQGLAKNAMKALKAKHGFPSGDE